MIARSGIIKVPQDAEIYEVIRNERYNLIDPEIEIWAIQHSLPVYTTSKDTDVRAVSIPRPRKGLFWHNPFQEPFQIWIDPPDLHGSVTVHAWDRRSQNFVRQAKIGNVIDALEEALAWVRSFS